MSASLGSLRSLRVQFRSFHAQPKILRRSTTSDGLPRMKTRLGACILKSVRSNQKIRSAQDLEQSFSAATNAEKIELGCGSSAGGSFLSSTAIPSVSAEITPSSSSSATAATVSASTASEANLTGRALTSSSSSAASFSGSSSSSSSNTSSTSSSSSSGRVSGGSSSGGSSSSSSSSSTTPSPEDDDPASRITWIGAGCNLVLSGLKGAVGSYTGSQALLADAAHSLSDLITDVVTLITIRYTALPPDSEYPWGYNRYEQIGTLCVSGMICAAGLGIGIEALESLVAMKKSVIDDGAISFLTAENVPLALFPVAASFACKEWLYQVTVKIGKANSSPVLIANAWHHRSDAMSSLVAGMGIVGVYFNYPLCDPIGGILVAGMVVKTGMELGWESIIDLADKNVADPDLEKELITVALKASRDIYDVERIKVRKAGACLFVNAHLIVSPRLSLSGYQYAEQLVTSSIKREIPSVVEVNLIYKTINEKDEEVIGTNGQNGNGYLRTVPKVSSALTGIVPKKNNMTSALTGSSTSSADGTTNSDGVGERISSPSKGLFTRNNSDDFLPTYSVTEMQQSLKLLIEQNYRGKVKVQQVDVHFLQPLSENKINAEIVIVSDLRTLGELREQAREIRELVMEEVKRCGVCTSHCAQIVNVEVRLELSDGCSLITQDMKNWK